MCDRGTGEHGPSSPTDRRDRPWGAAPPGQCGLVVAGVDQVEIPDGMVGGGGAADVAALADQLGLALAVRCTPRAAPASGRDSVANHVPRRSSAASPAEG